MRWGEDDATAYLMTKKVVPQTEDGGALVALEYSPLPFDMGLLDLARAGVELVYLCGSEALRSGEEDVHR